MAMGDTFLLKDSEYIGDGVYASFDGFSLWLQCFNGIEVYQEICLEPSVWFQLNSFLDRAINAKIKETDA